MDQVENQTAPSPQNLPERPSFWYLLKNPPTYHKPLVTLVAVTFFLSALGTIVYFTTIGKGQISFSPPPTAIQQPTPPTSTLPTSTPDLYTESSRSAMVNWKTYTSKNNRYSFDYPSDLNLEKSSSVYLKKGSESNLSILIEIAPTERYVSEKEKPFKQWAAEKLKERCLADGPNGEIYCDKTIKEIPFTNEYGVEGYEIYLDQIQIVNNSQGSQVLGPMFALDVSKYTNNSTYALLIIPSYGFPDKNEEGITRKIVDTIRF